MRLDQLKPNIIIRGAIFPEPVQVIVVIPMGESVKLIGKGLTSGKVHEPILNAEQLASLESQKTKLNAILNKTKRLSDKRNHLMHRPWAKDGQGQ